MNKSTTTSPSGASGVGATYWTTPIYYANDKPHIGTAYSTIAVDVFNRYHQLRGARSRFLTGLDEHGLKLERRAKDEGLAPAEFVDRMAPPFRDAWRKLGCDHDDFIRTTEPRHKQRVQELWRRVQASGDIYLGHYEDWYCVDCENFYTDKDLLDGGVCPIHKRPIERLKEESYFFRLSRYTDRLLRWYDEHPTFVRPEGRLNEVRSFVREGLRDLSISRTSFRWGIPVPGDSRHIMYVWFDALANYWTALQSVPGLGEVFWPPHGRAVHVVGKDILRFHAVYWPAFLMSAGIEPPTEVWAHGWLTVDGEKMSKSRGNFISPLAVVEKYGADALRYYLMRDISFGQDGDFSHAGLHGRYQGELGNGLGNLLSRMLSGIVVPNLGGVVPRRQPTSNDPTDRELIEVAQRVSVQAARHMQEASPHKAVDSVWELVAAANRYVDRNAPWNLAKTGARARLEQVVYHSLESLRWLSVLLHPWMPEKTDALRHQLGLPHLLARENTDLWPSQWGGLAAGLQVRPGPSLFPKIEEPTVSSNEPSTAASTAVSTTTSSASSSATSSTRAKPATENATASTDDGSQPPAITIDDVAKVELKLGLVQQAERVPKSDKLLRLMVDLGEPEPRQILAGIGKTYAPEALVGRRIVVVANLAPRKMMGLMSHGMVLAASDEAGLSVLGVDSELTPGSAIR
jgi:methionyl-tRNA synthetase